MTSRSSHLRKWRRLPRGRRNEIIAFLAGALAVGLWFALVLLADRLPAPPEEHSRHEPSTQQLVRQAAQRVAGEVAACLGRGGEKPPICRVPGIRAQ